MVLRAWPHGCGILCEANDGDVCSRPLQRRSWQAHLDPPTPEQSRVEAQIDAKSTWTGEPDRDAHLRSADFLDVEHYPAITYSGDQVQVMGAHDYLVKGQLTIRGISRDVTLKVRSLGQWLTPWWEDGVDKGPRTRAGFYAEAEINRYDFGASWNSALDRGGVVVGAQSRSPSTQRPS
jgi:polyisoprenoid-binding protein YceI